MKGDGSKTLLDLHQLNQLCGWETGQDEFDIGPFSHHGVLDDQS